MNETPDDLLPEYDFDYSQAQPNRFAGRGAVAVTLRADVLAIMRRAQRQKGYRWVKWSTTCSKKTSN